MEQQLEQMKETLKATSYIGSSGSGLVTIEINGDKEVKSIKIKPECVDVNDLEGLEDLIKAAFQDAHAKASEESQGGMSLPGGLSFPF